MQQEDKNFCTLYLVRHGETEMNKKEQLQGQTDSPLTELGVEQVTATAEELKDITFDAIFSSDLHRAKRTAEIIRRERQIAIQTTQALRERSYGSFERKPSKDYRENFREDFAKIKLLPGAERKNYKLASDIESDEELVGRFITQLREIAVAHPGKNVLVATHGACIRTFLQHAGYLKYEANVFSAMANGGYAVVDCDGIDFFIKKVKGLVKK